ncbi:Ankyrin repeat protein [Pseudohyphozyma bogoriensis]|nr:Ankyrin repeat protein [Pseudohyphozyma bogoriensis]
MASPNEQLLFAAKTDSEELLQSILAGPEDSFDVNHQDGLGNTGREHEVARTTSIGRVRRMKGMGWVEQSCGDGLVDEDDMGMLALHYAASTPSPTALELLLEFDGTDVDLQNRLDGATPLHLAVKLEHEGARQGVVEMLLDAGADPRIKDKNNAVPAEYLNADSNDTDRAIQRAIAIATAELTVGIDSGDIANDDDDDGEPGSGSGSEDED